jgi:predicted nucleic-acid-binding Zn-ribbon protein
MRHTNTCPKCNQTEIFISKGKKHDQHGNKIRVSGFKRVPLDHYTCINCGYTEEWVTEKASLDFLRKKFDRLPPNKDYSDFV